MSTEDRLLALVAQARQQRGDAILHNPADLTSLLTGQAPDLFGEVRALSDALSAGAERIPASPEGDAAAASLATDIATREKLSIATVQTAITVARRLGPIGSGGPVGTTGSGDWAGDSVAVGGAVPPGYAPPPGVPYPQPAPLPTIPPAPGAAEPFYKNKVVWGGVAAVAVIFVAMSYKGSTTDPQPNQPGTQQPAVGGQPDQPGVGGQPGFGGGQQPMPQQPDQGGGAPMQPDDGGQQPMPQDGSQPDQEQPGEGQTAQNGPPMLVSPQSGQQAPNVPLSPASDGRYAAVFTVPFNGSPIMGVIKLPKSGWDEGPAMIGFARSDGGQTVTMQTKGQVQFSRVGDAQQPLRMGQVHWDQDGLGIGNVCVGFQGKPGQDVEPNGALMCVLDASCRQPLACGTTVATR